jgi:hypothetical protein
MEKFSIPMKIYIAGIPVIAKMWCQTEPETTF